MDLKQKTIEEKTKKLNPNPLMPFENSLIEITNWDPETTLVINSKTRPLLLSLSTLLNDSSISTTTATTSPGYIFKNSDDISRDTILLGLIQLMDDIFREELRINFEAVQYKVLPTGKGKGVIEVVPKAKTLFEIKICFKTILTCLVKQSQLRRQSF